MATTLISVETREVVRCDFCSLVQYRTTNSLCRKCRRPLDIEEPAPLAPQLVQPSQAVASAEAGLQVAAQVREIRRARHLSQRQLAMRMQVPRTYVSKIENEKATPTLSSLERLARALEVKVPDLLNGGQRSREDEILELMGDEFIAELIPLISKLNGMQWSSVLAQVRDMTIRPRRSS